MGKLLLSWAYFASFVSMGLVLSNLGPVMLILMDRLDVEISVMGYIVASRSLGYLCGCFLAGPAYDKYATKGNKVRPPDDHRQR
jgi:MFS family permease